MPLPYLLLLASALAAVAFFLAGFLLSTRRSAPAPEPGRGVRERLALPNEDVEELRRRLAVAEEERDQARAAEARGAEKEKVAALRLRAAEDANREAFEREEKAAEAWATTLEAAKAEQKRRDQGLEREVEELRAQLGLRRQGEQEEQRRAKETEAEGERLRNAVEEAVAAEKRARAQLEEAEAASRGRLAEAEVDALARVAQAEAAHQTKLAEVEEAQRARLAETEAALAAKLAAAEAERAELAAALAREASARQAAEEARQELDLRRRAADEVVELLREQVASTKDALRGAETAAKERDRLAQENAELREAKATAEHEAEERAGHEDVAKDVLVELAAAQAKLAELASLTEENRRLRDEIAELRTHQEASVELERLTVAHKQVRLDAELMARRLQELLHDQAELAPVRAQAAEAAALAQEVEYLRRREKALEAQLYAAGAYASREIMALTGELPVVTPVTDLETNLTALVGQGGPRTAVLADRQGFLIASAGESVAEEGLAAFAAVAGDMVARARQLLPLADVESVRVADANRMVLTCHLFASAGEPMGVATLGPGDPPADKTAQAIAGLAAIVAGGEASAEETPTPEPASGDS